MDTRTPAALEQIAEKRARLVELVKEDPSRSTTELSQLTGWTRQRVHQILEDMGYVKQWRKPPVSASSQPS